MDICLQLAEKRNVQLIVTTHESKYVLDKCNKMGFQFCVTNPCFEFWLLLHFDEGLSWMKKNPQWDITSHWGEERGTL